MPITATAVYENGVLRLLTPLELPEHTQVQIYVQPTQPETDAMAHRREVRAALVAAGLSLPATNAPSPSDLLSADQRAELARRFSAGRPLSELIIEEREGR